jgi:hypothetical protein
MLEGLKVRKGAAEGAGGGERSERVGERRGSEDPQLQRQDKNRGAKAAALRGRREEQLSEVDGDWLGCDESMEYGSMGIYLLSSTVIYGVSFE